MKLETLIVAPLQKELDALMAGFTARGYVSTDARAGRLPLTLFPELHLGIAVGGLGKAQYAAQTQHLVDASPGLNLVVCAGAAGALADAVVVGDVVVATATVEHDYRNNFGPRRTPTFPAATEALARLQRLAPTIDAFTLHFGLVASGDEDVVDTMRREELYRATGALAVAWEGAGGARACAFSQVPYVEIRGITDRADATAPGDFNANLRRAMDGITALITALITAW